MRYIEAQRPLIEIEAPAVPADQLPLATDEQAQAVDQLFATQRDDSPAFVDAINLAAAGMLLHDIVADTLAPPTEEEEEDQPAIKKKGE
jgi:hypothetical protein